MENKTQYQIKINPTSSEDSKSAGGLTSTRVSAQHACKGVKTQS